MPNQKQNVNLYISCKNLSDKDILSKSDPYVEVYENNRLIGKTEQISDNLNPSFSTPIELIYQFEFRQNLKFVVKDKDSGRSSDYLGEVEVSLGNLVANSEPGSEGWTKKLDKVEKGLININVIPVGSTANKFVSLSCDGLKLDKMDWFGKSDPYYEIYCGNLMIYRSETVKKNLNPKWKEGTFPFGPLEASGGFKVKVLDWNRIMDNKLIGECNVPSIDFNEPNLEGTKYEIINKKKNYNKKTDSGTFSISKFKITTRKSFMDYIHKDNVRLNFSVSIDFTGSNGDPKLPTSLHHKSVSMRSPYTDALAPIFLIVQDYDTDKKFPAYGFGAKLLNGQYSDQFPLNLDTQDPNMSDLNMILQNYWNCVDKVTLWGPTNFAPIIKTAVDQSLQNQQMFNDKREYSVLLILTDGAISDMDNTMRQIARAQTAPISIIIVGVGSADFSSMELLDGDAGGNSFSKVRDCVQFCSYKEVENMFTSRGANLTDVNVFNEMKERLAAKVLEELPKQLEVYMRLKHPNI